MKIVAFIFSVGIIWFVLTIIFGAVWGALGFPYKAENSMWFNLAMLPFSLYIGYLGFIKKR